MLLSTQSHIISTIQLKEAVNFTVFLSGKRLRSMDLCSMQNLTITNQKQEVCKKPGIEKLVLKTPFFQVFGLGIMNHEQLDLIRGAGNLTVYFTKKTRQKTINISPPLPSPYLSSHREGLRTKDVHKVTRKEVVCVVPFASS